MTRRLDGGGLERTRRLSCVIYPTRANDLYRLPEPPLELVLPEELQDSLRLLKPEGNLLKDRFRNILVSGKMETRKPLQQPKKKRVSYTEKWSYKDWNLAA